MARCTFDNLIKIFQSSIRSVLPENLIRKSINYNTASDHLQIFGSHYSLKQKKLYVVGTGKAVKNMALEVENIFQSKIEDGILSIPMGSFDEKTQKSRLIYMEGAKNNLPDKEAENTSNKIKSLISNLSENDFLLVLISGGGSALLPLPKEPITLEEKTNLIKKLANAGVDIKELNTVRKQISDLKGGKLAIQAQPAQIVTLILSDIVADPLDLIASGPTVENKDSKSAALDVIQKYKLYNDLPASIRKTLETNEEYPEFPQNVQNFIIGSNKLSIEAAKLESKNLGYIPLELSHILTGNIKIIAQEYLKMTMLFCDFMSNKIDFHSLQAGLKNIQLPLAFNNIHQDVSSYSSGDICLILGGETTVEVTGSGLGGRNQQLALEFSLLLHENKEKLDRWEIYFLSAGTDGIDGPTNAAGAIGYHNLVADSEQQNLDVKTYLKNNDSYTFYQQFNNGELHVITGHTNTNVMDIHLILIKQKNN